jgi:AcrR family transcriptional regulator
VGIDERRAREKAQRRADIVRSAWRVAEQHGWVTFSMERVAADAELGRATLYGYFESLDALVQALAEDALDRLSTRVAEAPGLAEALDAPVRFSQSDEAAFALLFPPARDPRPHFSSPGVSQAQASARELLGRLHRLASRSGASLPEDVQSAAAFVAAVSMAGAVVPELRTSTTLRRRWQEFCLGMTSEEAAGDREQS